MGTVRHSMGAVGVAKCVEKGHTLELGAIDSMWLFVLQLKEDG